MIIVDDALGLVLMRLNQLLVRHYPMEQLQEPAKPIIHRLKHLTLLTLINIPQQLNPFFQKLRRALVLPNLIDVMYLP